MRPFLVRHYVQGSPVTLVETVAFSSVVEIVTGDGRTVQVTLGREGEVSLRAWGNVPAKVGNMEQISFHAVLRPEEQTHDPVTHQPIEATP